MMPERRITVTKPKTAVPKVAADMILGVEERQNVGARNPYALADAKEGGPHNWHAMDASKKKEKLEKVLSKPFHQLFDPKHESPLYTPAVIEEVTGRVVTQAGAPCTGSVSRWDPITRGGYFTDPLANLAFHTDPVQGCGVDCYLLAAMCSISWVSPHLVPSQPGPSYTYSFWNTSTSRKETVTVDNKLPLDTSGLCVYARSPDPLEMWPPLFEKAYGIWRKLPGYDLGTPDLARDSGGNPVTSLLQIAKGVDSTYASKTETTASCSNNWSTMMSRIYTRFDPANSNCLNITASKTKVPMVAYTYITAPGGVTYSSDTIVANHSYSVLGLYKYNNKCYIVLRNPYGPTVGDPAIGGSLAGGTWGPPTNKYYLKGGSVNNSLPAPAFSVNLALNDGTFALDTAVFMTHFQALGYIL
jgi:hypothetical protein